jgi:hypothetical protein
MLISLLLFAAARAVSLSAACKWLRGAPSDETARQALLATLPSLERLEQRTNAGLVIDLPRAIFRRAWRVAIDLHEIPYHGLPQREARELRHRAAKRGTTHFHTYATACILSKGYRFTVATTWVRGDESLVEVLRRVLQQVRRNGLKIQDLLLDREFYTADVVRYLHAARYPFIMPVAHRGRTPKDPTRARSTRRFLSWKCSGWSTHTWCNRDGQRTTAEICVSIRNYRHKGKRRRQVLVFACGRIAHHSPFWIRETYRKRFGIETSYRQLGQARIRTSTRDPLRRLLFVAIALILRNVWAWIHLMLLDRRFGWGVRQQLSAMTLDEMLHSVETFLEIILKCLDVFGLKPKPPPAVPAA